ncbi:hypothetical protein SY83_13125 [Paenibacillus swuensis]|uniref:Glycosyl transferase family 1 domain-containing protein n=1 Tax=Paenibacillus swuensis TaxID=1178515 RepID=A0A172TJ31_9BACL|nr:glycosyltransferase [Paenibacillus swuensis]ANE47051.1 hypothetical protein SY83_13125 [Paenibacillus swuensis]
MEINQLLSTVSYGDAVSNSALTIMRLLRDHGIKSNIYAENVHPKLKQIVKDISDCPKNKNIIYHKSIGSQISETIRHYKKKKVMIYHNITPSQFFSGYSNDAEHLCKWGREQLGTLKPHVDAAFGDSEYNCNELINLGYENVNVLPLLVNFNDFEETQPNSKILENISKVKGTKLLFVGRIAPNKKQEDIIKTFYVYKKYFDAESKLYLVGNYLGMERYYLELKKLISIYNLDRDVVISGHVTFDEIVAYYQKSDVFLVMSEHEGFCVPLLEAMHHEIPIVCFNSSALPETLGNGGILFKEKNHQVVAGVIHYLQKNPQLRDTIITNQKRILEEQGSEKTSKDFIEKILSVF